MSPTVFTVLGHSKQFILMTRDARNIFFISVQFRIGFLKKTLDSVRNEFGSVQKTRLCLDIIVTYCRGMHVYSKYYSESACHDFGVTYNNDNK